jgi:hypothetical protein
MIKLIAAAGFALSVATSAQAMTPAPIPQTHNDSDRADLDYIRAF